MADFAVPFATDTDDLRYPTTTEKQLGFPAGPLDKDLFNGLMQRVEAEIGEVISHAGITFTDDRHTLLREAIAAMIASATGEGDTDQFVLMTQARARMPFFPETQTSDGKLGVTSPSTGQIRIPAGVIFMHRGIYPITTSETDIATSASKTYHLRWNETDGFTLEDLSDTGYNPGALSEGDKSFDSTYDDILFSRIITTSGNIANITNLVNKHVLEYGESFRKNIVHSLTDRTLDDSGITLNWARTPVEPQLAVQYIQAHSINTELDNIGHNLRKWGFQQLVFDRYGMDDLEYRYQDSDGSSGGVIYTLNFRNG